MNALSLQTVPHNKPNAADGRKPLVKLPRLSAAADWERYAAFSYLLGWHCNIVCEAFNAQQILNLQQRIEETEWHFTIRLGEPTPKLE